MSNKSNNLNVKSKLKKQLNSPQLKKPNKINPDEKCKLLETENDNLKKKLEYLEQEIHMKNSLSKQDDLIQKLQNENTFLKSKLLNQEEDFRSDNKSLMQKLTSLVRTNEFYQKEVDLFNNEANSYEKHQKDNKANDLFSIIENSMQENQFEIESFDKITNFNDAKILLKKQNNQMNKLILTLKESLKQKQEELVKYKNSRETLIKLNESKIKEIKAELDVQIESLKRTINKLEDEKGNLYEKCSIYEEHIRLLESTVSCVSSEKSDAVNELSLERDNLKKKVEELEFKLEENVKENDLKLREIQEDIEINFEEQIREHKNEKLKLQVKIYDLAKRYSDMKHQYEKKIEDLLNEITDREKNETKYLNAIKFMKRELQLARNCCC